LTELWSRVCGQPTFWPTLYMVPLAQRVSTTPHPKWNVDRFSRFSTAHALDQQRDRQTDQRRQWVTWPVTHVTHQSIDPWPATHDYSRVMTPDYCSFQSVPLSGSALKSKHHHCHKILSRNNWIKLTLWLKLCRKSLQCLEKTKSWVNGSRVTHVTHSDLLTHLTCDPLSSLRQTDHATTVTLGRILFYSQRCRLQQLAFCLV